MKVDNSRRLQVGLPRIGIFSGIQIKLIVGMSVEKMADGVDCIRVANVLRTKSGRSKYPRLRFVQRENTSPEEVYREAYAVAEAMVYGRVINKTGKSLRKMENGIPSWHISIGSLEMARTLADFDPNEPGADKRIRSADEFFGIMYRSIAIREYTHNGHLRVGYCHEDYLNAIKGVVEDAKVADQESR